MKKFLVFIFFTFSIFVSAQAFTIRWNDSDGREFKLTAPNARFSYVSIQGDRISYDFDGRVSRIGPLRLDYDIKGRLTKLGNVCIYYDIRERVYQIGGLRVYYDFEGRVERTSGSVL